MSSSAFPRATRKEWIGLAVLALPCLLYSMDLTVLNLAVPSLTQDLKPSSAELLWIIDIYGFLVAGSLITMGTLGDRIGRRKLLMIGATFFGLASVLAAFSNSAEMLIAARALLGVAGATLAPSTLSLIRNMFLDPKQRTVAVGVWITSYSVGAAIGPLLGGALLEFFWWGSVFLLAVPVMALLLILGPMLLPEFKDPNAGRMDVLSAGLSLAAVLSLIYGLKQTAQDGFGTVPAISVAIGLVIGAAFVIRQRGLADPLIDLGLFKIRQFSASLTTFMFGGLAIFGAYVFIAQYLQLVRGYSPLEAGLWTVPWASAFVVGSMLTPVLIKYVRPGYLMIGGLVIAAPSFLVLTQVSEGSGMTIIVVSLVVSALGLAPVFTLGTDMIIGAAPPERAGAAASISETGAELGAALGIAVLGSIGTAVYRDRLADGVPAGVSAEQAETARDTLGGAIAVAAELPADVSAQLLATANNAFIDGMQIAALVSTAIVVAMALVAALLLRDAHPHAEADEAIDESETRELAAVGVGD